MRPSSIAIWTLMGPLLLSACRSADTASVEQPVELTSVPIVLAPESSRGELAAAPPTSATTSPASEVGPSINNEVAPVSAPKEGTPPAPRSIYEVRHGAKSVDELQAEIDRLNGRLRSLSRALVNDKFERGHVNRSPLIVGETVDHRMPESAGGPLPIAGRVRGVGKKKDGGDGNYRLSATISYGENEVLDRMHDEIEWLSARRRALDPNGADRNCPARVP